ncbi:hypothetical protein E3O06_11805 [Cryobacterium glaciale]|uniref:Uncharacterized protein n=1 Tax=Cryobacterium glaciale TaxID=1259145 RepID=A0A4R8UVY8_9MICO|nr:hypothetical protein [Cryobacterium glaciale]TFB71523.1 hypothetical protein E3O06_11805 [Cryobacterium glaciale]
MPANEICWLSLPVIWATQLTGVWDDLELSPSLAATSIRVIGPFTAELRRAEAHFVDIVNLLPRVIAARGFEDAPDIAAVLRARVAGFVLRDTGASGSRRAPRLVAGLIPRAIGPMDVSMRAALVERAGLIESRASE